MKIGLLGGSFDPIHNGHLYMAKKAYEQYNLDEVWLIPNGHAPHKDEDKMADAFHRLAMCNIAAEHFSYLKVCDIEVKSEQSSYTYLTIQKLTNRYPQHEFYFIMGADSLDYFEKWKNPHIISSLCKILVINRDEFTESDLQQKIQHINQLFPADIFVVHCKKMDISSTEIRKSIEENEEYKDSPLDYILPEVRNYINNHNLYQ
ncbi:MAG: nicotinate-nucleotide adenylyltransferase [Lachnospiraceae bacterium]|nr:nicotinate-nucleotide adenylyltransferase [Lachnospiraceae bacterium]